MTAAYLEAGMGDLDEKVFASVPCPHERAMLRGLMENLWDAGYWLVAADFYQDRGRDGIATAYRQTAAQIQKPGRFG